MDFLESAIKEILELEQEKTIKRLTCEKDTKEMNMMELAFNCMHVIDHESWYRDYDRDIKLCDWIREYNVAMGGDPLPEDDKELSEVLTDALYYSTDSILGRVALTYRIMWAMSMVREKLMEYENTRFTPEEISAGKVYFDWIPVEERLPEEKLNPLNQNPYRYPVTVDICGIRTIRYYLFFNWHWYNEGPREVDEDVVAWMQLGEAY